ncbi:MAG: hypothetical protein IPM53_31460 [Anaerolineaceae bacterium]|nr:hypothetical protein [Anaerolineaceae bacterium]
MDEERLQDLIAEATVDCYDEIEAFWGMLAQLDIELRCPFEATVLGDKVQVLGVDNDASSERRGVMVTVEKNGRTYAFPLAEIEPVQQTGHNAEWVAAYKLWSR